LTSWRRVFVWHRKRILRLSRLYGPSWAKLTFQWERSKGNGLVSHQPPTKPGGCQVSGSDPNSGNIRLCEIATGQLDLAASTLATCTLNNSLWDYPLKWPQCRLALARKDHTKAIAIADALVADDRPFKLGQYLPEALFLQATRIR